MLSLREEMVYNLKNSPLSGAYRKGPFKIIFGKKFNKQGWYDTDNTALQCSRMIKDKKSKRREESSNSRPPRRKKKKKKNGGSGRKGRVIELLTSKKIDKTLASGPAGSDKQERGDWRWRKRRREMMMRKKQKKNKSQRKRKGLGNKNKGKSFPKQKRIKRKNKGTGRGKQGNRNKFKIRIKSSRCLSFRYRRLKSQ